ncbi:DUF2690 domain-containing protein [Streptomyces sp. NPDC050211]|uniref:helix-turn-helix domain-containing protein n=1 Tax=Streptomyces sp. NPDC050211 TaxID=3154932 RepID=UPI0034456A08
MSGGTQRPAPSPSPSPERARLTAALRELKARTGLSLAGLEDRTPYSKSSWERYLNGKTMPPRQAVQALCQLAGEPEGRPLALWEIAEAEWRGRAREAGARVPAPAPDGAEVPRAGGRGVSVAVIVTVVACAVAVGGVALALFLLLGGEEEPQVATVSSSPTGPRCRGAECEGRNPMHMGCGRGPDTLASYRTATGARMELRYSEACGAGWARVWDTRVGDRIAMTAEGGHARTAEVVDEVDAQSYVYTAMSEARPGTVVRACFRPAADGGERECFDDRVG